MFINFSDIPGHNNLFLDYLYEPDNIETYYPYDFRDRSNYRDIFVRVIESRKVDNRTLAEIINSQYDNLIPSPKTLQNISSLKEKNTLAIVTGQQLGLFGGPLYTFYKIISAIKLSRSLNEIYEDFHFVPVFWLEGDDHDFKEISSFNILDKENNLKNIKYIEDEIEDDNHGSVGNILIDNRIDDVFKELKESLRETEFTPALFELLKSSYKKGESFKNAFKNLIFSFFDDYGLIIFDPQDKKIKELLKPVFKKEIIDFRKHSEAVINTSAELEINYHAQVKVRPINLFLSYDNGRHLIEPHEDLYGLKRKRKKFTAEEILELLEKVPESFSPNVLLRPLCQDYIFPTAFYVGGPSEICYFAQTLPLYASYDVVPPIIYPRASITIVEKSISGLLKKYNLSPENVFQNGDKVIDNVLDTLIDTSVEELFANSYSKVELVFDELRENLFALDKTISDASIRTKEKILKHIDELKIKSVEAQRSKHEAAIRQVQKIVVMLYADSTLQERKLNFIYFVNKYGFDLVKIMFQNIVINKFEHQLFEL